MIPPLRALLVWWGHDKKNNALHGQAWRFDFTVRGEWYFAVGEEMTDIIKEIQRLNELREAGHLSQAEFDKAKAKLLGTPVSSSSASTPIPEEGVSDSLAEQERALAELNRKAQEAAQKLAAARKAEEAKKAAEAARKRAEEEAKKRAEEEARKKIEDEIRLKIEEESRKTAEEEKKKEEERRRVEETIRTELAETERRLAEEVAQKKVERRRVEETVRTELAETERRLAEEVVRKKAEEEAARKKVEEEAAQKNVEEEAAQKKAKAGAARKKVEELLTSTPSEASPDVAHPGPEDEVGEPASLTGVSAETSVDKKGGSRVRTFALVGVLLVGLVGGGVAIFWDEIQGDSGGSESDDKSEQAVAGSTTNAENTGESNRVANPPANEVGNSEENHKIADPPAKESEPDSVPQAPAAKEVEKVAAEVIAPSVSAPAKAPKPEKEKAKKASSAEKGSSGKPCPNSYRLESERILVPSVLSRVGKKASRNGKICIAFRRPHDTGKRLTCPSPMRLEKTTIIHKSQHGRVIRDRANKGRTCVLYKRPY